LAGPTRKARARISARSCGYYTDDGKLIYAGRVPDKVLADLRRRLEPLARSDSPLSAPPPRKTRFGSPLVLSRVHLGRTAARRRDHLSNLDRGQALATNRLPGLRSDKPAMEVRRETAKRRNEESDRATATTATSVGTRNSAQAEVARQLVDKSAETRTG
jgi:hypothetical protein